MIAAIVRAYSNEHHTSKMENLTINVAAQLIGAFLIWCAHKAVENLPDIIGALKQAYVLLEQLIQQAG